MKMETFYLDRVISKDVGFILEHSPCLGIDLGVLMFIYGARAFRARVGTGTFVPKGWTQLPITWYADRTGVSDSKIRESIGRLKSWGIIIERKRDNRHQSRIFLYKKHQSPHLPIEEIKEIPERPPLMEDEGGVFGEVYVWDNDTYHMEAVKVGAKEYSQFPICPVCGRVTHPTEGWESRTDMCCECHIASAIHDKEIKERVITYEGYEKHFTEEEMRQWIKDTAVGG